MLSARTDADERDLAAPRGLELDTRQDAAAVAADILSLERAATVDVAIVARLCGCANAMGYELVNET